MPGDLADFPGHSLLHITALAEKKSPPKNDATVSLPCQGPRVPAAPAPKPKRCTACWYCPPGGSVLNLSRASHAAQSEDCSLSAFRVQVKRLKQAFPAESVETWDAQKESLTWLSLPWRGSESAEGLHVNRLTESGYGDGRAECLQSAWELLGIYYFAFLVVADLTHGS